MTVNERIDMELDGSYRSQVLNEKRHLSQVETANWKRMSMLYNVGIQDNYIRQRSRRKSRIEPTLRRSPSTLVEPRSSMLLDPDTSTVQVSRRDGHTYSRRLGHHTHDPPQRE